MYYNCDKHHKRKSNLASLREGQLSRCVKNAWISQPGETVEGILSGGGCKTEKKKKKQAKNPVHGKVLKQEGTQMELSSSSVESTKENGMK